jgi:C1A family cysteine protease
MFLFLFISARDLAAAPDVDSDNLLVRSHREHWTFKLRTPSVPFATGLLHKKDEALDFHYVPLAHDEKLPAHFDLTPRLTPIKNQGQCGSCWAFAIVGAIENFPHAGTSPVSLSEQELISCDGSSLGCYGGYFTALNFAEIYGIASSQTFPYYGYATACYAFPPEAKVVTWAYLGSAAQLPTVRDIKTALIKSQAPVVTTVYADAAMQSYAGGIFNECFQAETNHMVDIVGWDDTDRTWIVRNSWGTAWGEKGYFRIPWADGQGNACNQIGTQAAYISNAKFY